MAKTKEAKEFLKQNKQAFKPLYYQALADLELNKFAQISKDIDTPFGTSKGFIDKLQNTFSIEFDQIKGLIQQKKVLELLYKLEPKCIMDVFWIGHFLGSKTMMDWMSGNLDFAPDMLKEFKKDIYKDLKSDFNAGTWDIDSDSDIE